MGNRPQRQGAIQVTEQTDTTNPMAAQLAASRQIIIGLITKANEHATAVRAARNTQSAVSDILKESDDPVIVKYREVKEQLEATLAKYQEQATEHVKANLLPKSDVDVDKLTEEYRELAAGVKGMTGALKLLGGTTDDLPEMLTLGRGSTTAGVTGIKRPRVDRIRMKDAADDNAQFSEVYTETEKDGETVRKTSFSVLTTKIKSQFGVQVDANSLREHAESVAGDYSTWSDRNGTPFEFTVSLGDDDNRKHVTVEVTPQTSNA